jgi:hypothetical protein
MLITLLKHRHADRRLFELELARHTFTAWLHRLIELAADYEYGATMAAGPPPQDHGVRAFGQIWPEHTAQMIRPPLILGRLRCGVGDLSGPGDLLFVQREDNDPQWYETGLYLVFGGRCHLVTNAGLLTILEPTIKTGKLVQGLQMDERAARKSSKLDR